MKSKKYLGYISLLLAACLYGLYGTYIRFIGNDFGPLTSGYLRYIFIIFLIVIYFYFFKINLKKIAKSDYLTIIIWTIGGLCSMVFSYLAYLHLPISTVILYSYSSTIILGKVLSVIIYKEKFTYTNFLALIVCILGIVFVSGDFNKLDNKIYICFALLAGVGDALWYSLSKKISNKYPNIELVFINYVVSLIICFIMAFLFSEKIPNINFTFSWFVLILFGLTSIAASVLTVYGFKKVEVSKGNLIMPTDIFFSSIFALIIFGEIMTINVFIGAILIFMALIIDNQTIVIFHKKH